MRERFLAPAPWPEKLLEPLKCRHFWIMPSLCEKSSKQGYLWDDVVPLARACSEAAPDRGIRGSHWPHPVSTRRPSNEAALLELLYRIALDAATLRKILVENPARPFGFDR